MAHDTQEREVFDCVLRTIGIHLARAHESPQRAEDLDVQEMGRVEIIIVLADAPLDTRPQLRLEQQLGDR